MENKNKQNMSNTMEINAILEEAKRNRTQANAPAKNVRPQNVQSRPQNVRVQNNRPQPQTAQSQNRRPQPHADQVDISSGFVVYDEAGKGKKNQKGKKGKKSGLTIAVIVAVIVFLCSAGFCAYTFLLSDFEYASNVYVNDICIGGMSEREAEELLAAEETKLLNSININVTAADKSTTLTKADIECTFNTDDVLSQAKQYSEDNLIPKGEQKYYIAPKVSDATLTKIVEKVSTDLNQKATDAKVTKFDSSKSGADRFTFEDEKTGVEINKTSFENQFKTFISNGTVSGEIQAESTNTEPKYTKEYLLKNIKQLSKYETVSTNGSNGNNNMKVAAKACNNSIINPGEIWSFNACTGNSNLESNGYKVAGVLIKGQSAQGVGGGICQTSTTIYNAGLLVGLHVQERRPHAFPSTYCPIGLDATIDYGNIDLKLKNTFDYQLFMECYMEGVTVVCKIYGLENPDFDEVKVTSSRTSGNGAVASRTFYKDGKRVTGDNLPDEDLPSSRYDTPGSSSSSNNNNNTDVQTPSQGGETPDPENPDTPPVDPPVVDPPVVDPPVVDPPVVEPPVVEPPVVDPGVSET